MGIRRLLWLLGFLGFFRFINCMLVFILGDVEGTASIFTFLSIQVEVLDANNLVVPDASDEISFSVSGEFGRHCSNSLAFCFFLTIYHHEGAGSLLGTGNGDPASLVHTNPQLSIFLSVFFFFFKFYVLPLRLAIKVQFVLLGMASPWVQTSSFDE